MTNTRWTTRLAILLLLTTIVVAYSATSVYQYWQAEAPYREVAAQERRLSILHSKMWDARERLEHNGARIPINKMCLPFQFIDLSTWHRNDSNLSDLSAFTHLPRVRHYENTLNIRLGPAVGSKAVAVLCGLKNIEKLEINGADLSDSEIEEIIRCNADCSLESFVIPSDE